MLPSSIPSSDRLYTSYWHGGFVILDIKDISKPKLISHLDWSPPFPWPTHTALPLPYKLRGRDIMLVDDEEVMRSHPSYPSFLWLVDITDQNIRCPSPAFRLGKWTDRNSRNTPDVTSRAKRSTARRFRWHDLRMDCGSSTSKTLTTEVARFMPELRPGCERVQSNDLTIDDQGQIYLLDRLRGMTILERV